MRIGTWSARRLLAIWIAWLGAAVLLGVVLPVAIVYWRFRHPPAPPASGTPLPSQSSDFVVSVVGTELAGALLVVLSLPVLLTLAWLYDRRHRDRPI